MSVTARHAEELQQGAHDLGVELTEQQQTQLLVTWRC